jgi:membrane-associated protein
MLALFKIPAHLGYLALLGLIGAESAGIPLPGETALIASGVLASHGDLHIELVVALAAVAAIVGDNIGYLIGRTGGRRLLERPGRLEYHRTEILRRGEPFFERHGPKAVFLGRWVSGLRIASAWLAGMNRMDWPTFLFWNALGGIAWAASIGLGVYFLGHVAEEVISTAGPAAAVAGVVALAGFFLWRWRRLRRDAAATP